jgi:glutaconate CoA-transferase subunit A
VIIIAEEIVAPEVIRSDPNRTVIPGFIVSAVVEEPWGAHPSAVQGYYGHDDPIYVDYAQQTRTLAGSREWYQKWVYGVMDRKDYLKLIPQEQLKGLQVKKSAPAAFTEFGY